MSAEVPEARGPVPVTFCTIVYAGLGLPAVAAGPLVTYQGMAPAMDEFAPAAAVGCVLILAVHPRVSRRPEQAV
ncbi:hypothetical protein [Streptomyces atratus]|uniref:hypothetical protein n=1 Tax=Streptomyces atratus TaxID=1893 RepID=UPI00340B335F